MANDSFKIKKGLNIEPNTSPNLSTDGDIGFNSTDSNLEVYTGGSVKKVITNSQTQTLTNKTLTAPVISTISNTGTLTLPTSTDTLVGRATTDTLTNKTLTAPTIDAVTFDGQASAPSNPSSGFYKVYVDDTTSKLQILDSTGTVTTVGTSAGGINYITNGDAEAATTGWATYADAAGTAPVDGTGGSPTTTFTRSTSSPLRGLGSFLLTKDAANRQGEGASYAFTIADADKAKMMQIDFELEVNSGTYATGDVAVYIVDVTNSTVIQPSGYQVENVGIESRQRLTFQTASNSTSYRLCFHVASTSASAYALKIDTITLGPQVVPLGAPVTDWVSYTPTLANLGTGSTTSNGAYWRRVGDSMQILFGARKDGSGGSGGTQVTMSLPSGYVIDTAKIPEAAQVTKNVFGTYHSASTAQTGTVVYNTTTTVAFYDSTGYFTGSDWDASENLAATMMVPIVGWSSSTVVSSSADTRVVALSALKTSGSHTSNGNYQDVGSWNSAPLDTVGGFDTSTGIYTVKVPGKYLISTRLGFAPNATGIRSNRILLNGATTIAEADAAGTSAVVNPMNATVVRDLVVGDTLRVSGFQSSGGNLNYTTNSGMTVFSVQLLQGPSQIAASEVIAARATNGSNITLAPNNNFVKVTGLDTETFDTHGAFDTSQSRFTAPAPGYYNVIGQLSTSGVNTIDGTQYMLTVYKNGSLYQRGNIIECDTSDVFGITVQALVQLNAGDYVEMYLYGEGNNSVSTISATQAMMSVNRLGGVM